jgi:hypothetical protein
MDYEAVKPKLLWAWAHGDGDPVVAGELYHDDALLEFPQSGERFRGRDNFTAWRADYPSEVEFELRSLRGEGDRWVGGGLARYDGGGPLPFVFIQQYRHDRIERETIYVTEPYPADEARAPYAEDSELEATPGLPVRVVAGSAA